MLNKFKNYIKSIVNETLNENKPEQEESYLIDFRLPEPARNELLACSIQRTPKDFVANIPKGCAMDDANSDNLKLQSAYAINGQVNDIIYTHFATQSFIGFQACSILTQNWLINKCCTLPPQDAMRPEYELSYKTAENEELDKDFLTEIKEESDSDTSFNIKHCAQMFAEKKRQFGQVVAYPIIEGADYSIPFNIDAIKPNSYKGMTVIDPVWVMPILDSEATSDPTSPRFYRPTYYQMPSGQKIHYTWIIQGVNGEVPDILKPTYYFGGYPIPQLVYNRVFTAEKVANEAYMLTMSKRLTVVDANLNTYLLNQSKAEADMRALSYYRDNWGVIVKRPDSSIQQLDTSLTDFDEVLMSQFQLVAAAAGITATKLLETQPKGFNSTGDYEDKQYKMLLTSIQEDDFEPLLKLHYRVLAKSKYNKDLDFGITFQPIDTPTEKELAEVNEINARTNATYINAGVISSDECRDILVKDETSGYNNLTGEAPDDMDLFSDEEEETKQDVENTEELEQ